MSAERDAMIIQRTEEVIEVIEYLIAAKAWDEGAEVGWQSSGEGHNGEYVHGAGTHDGRTLFAEANPDAVNPYKEKKMNLDEMTDLMRDLYVSHRVNLGIDEHAAHREFRDWLVMQS